MKPFRKNYNEDNEQNLRILTNIEKCERYSDYSQRLNRYFYKNSYENFIKDLKKNKKHKTLGLKDVFENEEALKKREYERQSREIKFSLEKSKLLIKELERQEEQKAKKLFKNRKFDFSKNNYGFKTAQTEANSKVPKLPEIPDIGQYHPNYDSIYKNRTNVFISPIKPKREEKSVEPLNRLCTRKIKHLLKEENAKNKEAKNFDISKFEYSNGHLNMSKSIQFLNQSNDALNKSEDLGKNMSCIKYCITEEKREKSRDSSTNRNKNETLSSSLPTYEKRTVSNVSETITKRANNKKIKYKDNFKLPRALGVYEFNKLSSNKYELGFPFIQNNGVPSLGYYKPKYDIINKKVYNVFFNKKEEDEESKRKKLMNQIMYNYHVPTRYISVDSLNDIESI